MNITNIFRYLAARRATLLLVPLICLTGVVGCGRGSDVAQVSGKVLYKDGSVPKAAIQIVRFEPAADSTANVRKAASGEISKEDGSFELYTRRPGDGVYRGKYVVTFYASTAARGGRSLIPEKYTNASTTPYHVSVQQDVNDLAFEIEPLQ